MSSFAATRPTSCRLRSTLESGGREASTWTTVADETNYPKPSDGSAQTFSFDQRPARYVRVEGTKLRNDSDTNDSTNWYRMELAELEVFSTAPPAV